MQTVDAGSPAAKAGLKGGDITAQVGGTPVALGGDIITKVDGQAVTSADDLQAIVSRHKPGDKVKVEFVRNRKTHTAEVTLGTRPSSLAADEPASSPRGQSPTERPWMRVASPRIKFCGITSLNDARLAVEAGAWALGTILWPGSERHCDPHEAARIAARAAPPGRDRRRLRQPAARRGHRARRGDRPVARAAARRRGAVLLRRGRPPDRREDHQGRARARAAPTCRRWRRSTPTSTCSTRTAPGRYGGTGETFDWELVRLRRTTVPLILSRRADAGERGRRDRRDPAVRRRRRERHRGVAGRQGPGEAARVRRGGPRRRGGGMTAGVGPERRSRTATAPTAASTCPRR